MGAFFKILSRGSMPKCKSKNITLHKKNPYQRVTIQSLDRLNHFHSEDKTNITIINRTPEEYRVKLELNTTLKDLICNIAKKTGKKIKILDVGCGEATTIDQLLSDNDLNSSVESISGISLHYFKNIKNVIEKHQKRFYYYLGTAENILSKAAEMHNAYDLILDVWGAYSYSENKLDLISLYHHALKPFGQAYIYSHGALLIKNEQGNAIEFSLWASQQHPETFSRVLKHDDACVIAIKKTTARLFLPTCNIESSEKKSTMPRGYEFSFYQLKKGNAIQFSNVTVNPISDQPMELRSLSFNK